MEKTKIILENDEAALVIGPENVGIYIPDMENHELVPAHVVYVALMGVLFKSDTWLDLICGEVAEGIIRGLSEGFSK